LQRFEQLHEVGAVHAQGFGGVGTVALAVCQGADDEFAAVAVDGIVERLLRHRSGGWAPMTRAGDGAWLVAGRRQDHGAFDDIARFADVARPAIAMSFSWASPAMVEKFFLVSARSVAEK
jgi:hypothetical protein